MPGPRGRRHDRHDRHDHHDHDGEPELEMLSGVMDREKNGSFGFIKQDSGEGDMFVMPSQCLGFGLKLPAIGDRVVYGTSIDPKSGRPRAEDVMPEESVEELLIMREEEQTGYFDRDKGTYGFIMPDSGYEKEMFVMPEQCVGFDCEFPAPGTRVAFRVVTDRKTHRLRCEEVRPEGEAEEREDRDESWERDAPWHSQWKKDERPRPSLRPASRRDPSPRNDPDYRRDNRPPLHAPRSDHRSDHRGGHRSDHRDDDGWDYRGDHRSDYFRGDHRSGYRSGHRNNDRGGYRHEDRDDHRSDYRSRSDHRHNDREDHRYDDREDHRYDDREDHHSDYRGDHRSHRPSKIPKVRTRGGCPDLWTMEVVSMPPPPAPPFLDDTAEISAPRKAPEVRSGMMCREKGNFGFIKQDCGEEDMFVMPIQCTGFDNQFPPIGTRVNYVVVLDTRTNRPRAEDVQPGKYLGTMDREDRSGNFGFIKQDSGDEDMFVMPVQCAGFGESLPPLGARVAYDIILDTKSGRPRAEDVWPEGWEPPPLYRTAIPPWRVALSAKLALQDMEPSEEPLTTPSLTGYFDRTKGKFGFIVQDSGDEDMFVMPGQCSAFGRDFPPLGSRVAYEVVTDDRTGRPRAENVRPEEELAAEALGDMPRDHDANILSEGWYAGTMDRQKGKYGFIKQDSGEDDMFVMPDQCLAFGGKLPPIGARVAYKITTDEKTGMPRSEDVRPESAAALAARNNGLNGRVKPY